MLGEICIWTRQCAVSKECENAMALFEHIWVLYKALSLLHSPLLPPAREELQLTLEHVRTFSCNTWHSDTHVASNTCTVYPPWSSPRPPRPNTRSSSLGPASSWRTVTENLCLCKYTGDTINTIQSLQLNPPGLGSSCRTRRGHSSSGSGSSRTFLSCHGSNLLIYTQGRFLDMKKAKSMYID